MTIPTIRHGGSEYSLETLGNLSGPELVKLHNSCASKIGQPETRRFSDKSSALKRTWAVLQICGAEAKNEFNIAKQALPSEQERTAAYEQELVRRAEAGEPLSETDKLEAQKIGGATAPSEPSTAKPAGDKTTEESKMAAAKRKTPTRAAKVEAPARGYAEDAKIKVLAKENPRRGEAAKRFEIYKTGMTVGEYTKKIGSRAEALVHLRWDVNKGHISVS